MFNNKVIEFHYPKAASKFLDTLGSDAIAGVATSNKDPFWHLLDGGGQGEALMQPENMAAPKSLLSVSRMTVLPIIILPCVFKHFSKSFVSKAFAKSDETIDSFRSCRPNGPRGGGINSKL